MKSSNSASKDYVLQQQAQMEQRLIEQGLQEKYDKAGIYCIKIQEQIVYIGKAVNMLTRVAAHLIEIQRSAPKENKYKVLHEAHLRGYLISFDVLYCSPRKTVKGQKNDIGKQEGVYIRKYLPALNYQIPDIKDWRCYTVNKCAKTITLDEILREA